MTLLRLALNDPSCELVRPSEWIRADPDLHGLRESPEFRSLVQELASRDFGPSMGPETAAGRQAEAADPWFARMLPTMADDSLAAQTQASG